MSGLPGIRDLHLAELEQEVTLLGMPKYRAEQIARWVQGKGAGSYAAMTNLPAEAREKLGASYDIALPQVLEKKVSRDGDTVKYLLRLTDGQAVESVLMKYRHGSPACLSTQVGCRMGCRMCASGAAGLVRNLTAGEIIGQIWSMQHDAGRRIGGIVLMGSGEPLDNYEPVLKFIGLAGAPWGLNIGQRHITISTCGIVPRIEDLMRLRLSVTLAVSLHAPNNKLREQLLPINKKYPLELLLPACRRYARETGRRITFEYALLKGVNDDEQAARELAGILRGIHCHINLIPANPVAGRNFGPA
ncbi:MAG: 23S rRNA (adenine(2503)-C(2))-methyltransferase RlmN, partial [Firmicutes bacterium]|nr:23S rRNA (adenine(2503)-C(2))-methyltransferase RlmN [Bacillota bacterium]